MQRRFVFNLILLLLLNLLVKPFYIFFIDMEILERVGAEVYGNYFALINFSFILNIILDMGMTNFNTRHISQNEHLLRKHFSGMLSLRAILFILYLIAVLVFGFSFGYSTEQLEILVVLAFNQGLVATILFLRSNLTALQLFKQDSLVSILDRLLLIGMMGALLWGGVTSEPFQIEWFIYGQTIAYFLTALFVLILVVRQTGKLRPRIEPIFSRVILKQSIPYALLTLFMMVHYKTDGVMLERMLDNGTLQAGIYASGYRFFEAANMVGYLFAVLLLPMFSRALKEKDDVGPLVALSFKLLFSGAFILAVVCFIFDKEILSLRFSKHLDEAAPVFGLLMFSFLAYSLSYIFGSLLTASGKLKWLNILAFSAMALNIIMNFFLIPTQMAYGSALASLVTQALVLAVQIGLMLHAFKFRPNWGLLLRTAFFVILVITTAWSTAIINWKWQLEFVFVTGAGLLFAILTGMLSVKRFFALIKQRQQEN
ncbi:oligosaccharide flippase family protein [Halocola ammonii]